MKQKRIIKEPSPNGRFIIILLVSSCFLLSIVDEGIVLIHTISGQLYFIIDNIWIGSIVLLLLVFGLVSVMRYAFESINYRKFLIHIAFVVGCIIIIRGVQPLLEPYLPNSLLIGNGVADHDYSILK
jgi:hypothetical protein